MARYREEIEAFGQESRLADEVKKNALMKEREPERKTWLRQKH